MIMPPTFRKEAFMFKKDEPVPEHVDAWPGDETEVDPTLFRIEGHTPLDGDSNWVAVNVEDRKTGEQLLAAARRQIDESWDPSMAISIDPDEFKPRVELVFPDNLAA
jgi:hypothetical protein